jgi:uncharacterized membrane protein YbhN (UPF0104 family)
MTQSGLSSRRKKLILRLSTALGIGLALGGAAFVAERIAAQWSEYGHVISHARWGWVLASVPLAIIGMSSFGLIWRRVIMALGASVRRRDVFVWYQLGQLGKYLPGGLWPVLGRSELAVRGGLNRQIAYNSVALSMGATYLCGALVSGLLLPFVLLTEGSIGTSAWVFVIIPLGLLVLHPRVLGKLFGLAERVLGKSAEQQVPPWSASVVLVARHAPPWLINGVATWLIALTFDPHASFVTMMFAGILSWVVGFIVIFVPGGIGVREASFTAIASVSMSSQIAATVAIVSRLVFMVADATGALAATPVASRLAASRASEPPSDPPPAPSEPVGPPHHTHSGH